MAALGWTWLIALLALSLLGYPLRRHHFEAAGLVLGLGVVSWAWTQGRLPCSTARSQEGKGSALVYILPAVVAAASFAWSLGLGPLSDDFVLQEWASTGNWSPDEWVHWRPVPLALWAPIYGAGGWTGLHALNVVLHSLNSALVASIGAAWMGTVPGIVAGVIFASFPASTETVAWTAGVFDLTATTCALVAVLVWSGDSHPHRRTGGVLLVYVVGMLSKESAVVIPAVLLLLTAASQPLRKLRREHVLGLVALFAVGFVFVAVRAAVSPAVTGHFEHLPTERREVKDLLVRPFAALSVPVRTEAGLGMDGFLIGLCVLLLVASVVIYSTSRSNTSAAECRPLVARIGVGWILLTAMPLLMQFYVSPTLEGSRYLYLPAVGFALFLSASLVGQRVAWRKAVAMVGLGALLSLYAIRLHEERNIWQAAAAVRDELLHEARVRGQEDRCSSVSVEDAPDNVRGVYIFRVGIEQALAGLPLDAKGGACLFRWTGSGLTSLDMAR